MYHFSLYVIIKHLIYCVIQITPERHETFAWLIVSVFELRKSHFCIYLFDNKNNKINQKLMT